MARRHWHLTTDPFDVNDFGNKIEAKARADELARWARRELRRLGAKRRAIYVVGCARKCVARPSKED